MPKNFSVLAVDAHHFTLRSRCLRNENSLVPNNRRRVPAVGQRRPPAHVLRLAPFHRHVFLRRYSQTVIPPCRPIGSRRSNCGGEQKQQFCFHASILIFLGHCWFASQYVFFNLISGSSALGCARPSSSIARETTLCSPASGLCQSKLKNLHVYLSFGERSIFAVCHGPSSIFTSTVLIGVPSPHVAPVSRTVPSFNFTARAMIDFTSIGPTLVSRQMVLSGRSSPRSVRSEE